MQGCIYYAPQADNGWAKRFLYVAGNRIEQFFYLQGDQKTQWYERQNGFLEKIDSQKIKVFSFPTPLQKKIMYTLVVPYCVMLVVKAIERLVEWLTRSIKKQPPEEVKELAKPPVAVPLSEQIAAEIDLNSDAETKSENFANGEKEIKEPYKGDTPLPPKKTLSENACGNLKAARKKLFETPPFLIIWQKLVKLNFLNVNSCYSDYKDPLVARDEGLLQKMLDTIQFENEFDVLLKYTDAIEEAKKSFRSLSQNYERKLPANEKEKMGFIDFFKTLFQNKEGLQRRLSFFYEGTATPILHSIIAALEFHWTNYICSLGAVSSKEYQDFAEAFQLFTKGLALLNELDSFTNLSEAELSELDQKQVFILYPLLALNCLLKFQVFIGKYPLKTSKPTEEVWDDFEIKLKGPAPLPQKKKQKEIDKSLVTKRAKPEPLRELFAKIQFAFQCCRRNAFNEKSKEEHFKDIANQLKKVLDEKQRKSLKRYIAKLNSGSLLKNHFLEESTLCLLWAQFLVNLTVELRKMETDIAKHLS